MVPRSALPTLHSLARGTRSSSSPARASPARPRLSRRPFPTRPTFRWRTPMSAHSLWKTSRAFSPASRRRHHRRGPALPGPVLLYAANVHDLNLFQRFLKLCAARTGQLLNLANLGNECGISQGTARAWLSVLEASYIVFRLPPHHRVAQVRTRPDRRRHAGLCRRRVLYALRDRGEILA